MADWADEWAYRLKQAGEHTDSEANRHSELLTDRQTDKQTETQTYRLAGRLTDRERQSYRPGDR